MRMKDIRALGPHAQHQIAEELKKAQKCASPEFDSELERGFYLVEIWPKLHSGEISKCETHRSFPLLPASEYCGIRLPKAEYTPDFVLTYQNGHVEVVEVKSKAVRKLQKSYVYRRRLFIDKYARPQGWTFREVII